jgi:hypothetical protein
MCATGIYCRAEEKHYENRYDEAYHRVQSLGIQGEKEIWSGWQASGCQFPHNSAPHVPLTDYAPTINISMLA